MPQGSIIMAEQNGMLVVVDSLPADAAADGWDATSGTTADAAWLGSGAASKIALLKNIAGGAGGTDPASPTVANQGTGGRGWLATIAGLLQLGAQTSAKSASMIPATDMSDIEPASTAISASPGLPAGGKGLTGWLSTIAYQLAQHLNVSLASALWYTDLAYAASNVAASGTATGGSHATAATSGVAAIYAYLQARIYATQTGTLNIYDSTSGTALLVGTAATAANAATSIKVPALGQTINTSWVNGLSSTAASAQLNSGFTVA